MALNIQKELNRGYEYKEDLFVPGYFELPIKKGETIIFSASTREMAVGSFKQKFTREVKKRIPRDTFLGSLSNSAQQFFVRKDHHTNITAGFPWYGAICQANFYCFARIDP